MTTKDDGYEYSRNPQGDGWEFYAHVVTPDNYYEEYRRAKKKPNNYPQPGNNGNAPGIIIPETQFYKNATPPSSPSPKPPGLPSGANSLESIEKYVAQMSPDKMRSESTAILVELGDYGRGRSIPGGTPSDYMRRDDLKTAIELLKDRVNKQGIDPYSVPELLEYAKKQLVDNGGIAAATASAAAGKVVGGYINKRMMAKAQKPCAC